MSHARVDASPQQSVEGGDIRPLRRRRRRSLLPGVVIAAQSCRRVRREIQAGAESREDEVCLACRAVGLEPGQGACDRSVGVDRSEFRVGEEGARTKRARAPYRSSQAKATEMTEAASTVVRPVWERRGRRRRGAPGAVALSFSQVRAVERAWRVCSGASSGRLRREVRTKRASPRPLCRSSHAKACAAARSHRRSPARSRSGGRELRPARPPTPVGHRRTGRPPAPGRPTRR